MTGVVGRLAEQVAHPRLATAVAVGLVVLATGGVLWVSGRDVLGLRLVVVGYVVALAGAAGYVSVAVFERRDRRLE